MAYFPPVKCEICHLHDAARAIRRVVDGEPRELYVCDACARTAASPSAEEPVKGAPRELADLLFGFGVKRPPSKKAADAVCPVCGMSRGEVRARHRLGCPRCFETFEADLRTFLSEQVPAAPRSGDAPAEALAARELGRLKVDLSKAVREDRFEDAARIADEIRARKDPRRGGSDPAHG